MKALHFSATWLCTTHTLGLGLGASDQPRSSSLIFSYNPEAFSCFSWSPGQSHYSDFQLVTLLGFWPHPPLSLKAGWMPLVTAGSGQTPASSLLPHLTANSSPSPQLSYRCRNCWIWYEVLALPLTNCVSFSKLLNFTEP